MGPLLAAVIPSVVNGISQMVTNRSNQSNFNSAQQRANEFAQRERVETQRYNSLENQFAQMARVGMNPNLLTGQMFEASSPVQNQSVAPPVNSAPQIPADSLGQSALSFSSAENQKQQAITTKDLRKGLIRQQGLDAEFTIANTNNAKASLPNIQKQFELLSEQKNSLIQSQVESDARTQNIREDTARQRELRGTWRRKAEREIDEIISRVAVNGAQRAYLFANKDYLLDLAEGVRFQNDITRRSSDYIVRFNRAQSWNEQFKIVLLNDQHNTMRFQFGQLKNYSDLEHMLGIANSSLQVVGGLIDIHPATQIRKDAFSLFGGSSSSHNSPSVNPYSGTNYSPTINF